jgi:arginase
MVYLARPLLLALETDDYLGPASAINSWQHRDPDDETPGDPVTAPHDGYAWATVEAPSALGLRANGVEGLPRALAQAGLLLELDAPVVATLEAPAKTLLKDDSTGILHAPDVGLFAAELAGAVGRWLDEGRTPLVLGGDCSILLGNALALHRRGRFGLLFLDGHADFYQPAAEPTGEAASMDLALVTGYGPSLVDEGNPLIRSEDAVAFAFRDSEVSLEEGSQPLPGDLLAFDLGMVQAKGVEEAAVAALAHLTRVGGPEGFWVHVDADVLADDVMPAVDYRLPGGLRMEELTAVLRIAMATGRVMGIEVTIYNPKLDPSGEAGRALAGTLARGLA